MTSHMTHHVPQLTKLSNPTVNIMKKKHMDQNGAPGISARPSGYATKANPGPTKRERLNIVKYGPLHLLTTRTG